MIFNKAEISGTVYAGKCQSKLDTVMNSSLNDQESILRTNKLFRTDWVASNSFQIPVKYISGFRKMIAITKR